MRRVTPPIRVGEALPLDPIVVVCVVLHHGRAVETVLVPVNETVLVPVNMPSLITFGANKEAVNWLAIVIRLAAVPARCRGAICTLQPDDNESLDARPGSCARFM